MQFWLAVLYGFLEQLGDSALYCSTDSVVYMSKPKDVQLHPTPGLSGLKNELKEGESISEVSLRVSSGPI